MKTRALALASAALLLLSGCERTAVRNERIQGQLEALQNQVGSTPLAETAQERLTPQRLQLVKLTDELEKLADKKETAELDWQLGECFRLRALFDEPGAWEYSERYLSLAVARDPKSAAAHLSLGQLYLTGGFDWASRAEREIIQSMEESGGHPTPAAIKGLFLACYYQGRWADAVQQADRYLAMVGHDDAMTKMRQMAETNGKRKGAKPS